MAEVQVLAQDTGDRFKAPESNTALQLASSLADLNPSLNNLMGQIAKKDQKDAEAQAKKDAFVTSGAKLADAVRTGSILPTQNPWYVQAYNRESAAVRGQDQLNNLAQQSATWPEQNDPQQFSQRWRKEVGALASQYSDTDEIAGFSAAEGQVTQQTLASNQAANVHRITEERTNNISQLTSEAILDASRKNAGSVNGTILAQAIEPAHLRFTATGGTEQDWHKIVVASVTSAAYNAGNSSLLDSLKDPALIGGPPAQMATQDPTVDPQASAPVSAPAKPFSEDDAAAAIKSLFPNARITSQARTPAQNKAVKGAANSMHVPKPGEPAAAIDVVVPGYTPQQVKAVLVGRGYPVTEFMHETATDPHSTGDHIHWGWRGASNPVNAGGVGSGGAIGIPAPPGHQQIIASGPSLYDQAGVADSVEHDRYIINSNAVDNQLNGLKIQKALRDQKGQAGADYIVNKYGTQVLQGNYDPTVITKDLTAQGYNPSDVAQTFNVLHSYLTDAEGVLTARTNMLGANQNVAKGVLDLSTEGRKNGWSQDYENRVGQAVLSGVIKADDGEKFVGDALEKSKADAHDTTGGGGTVKNFAQLGQHASSIAGAVTYKLKQSYGIGLSDQEQQEVKREVGNGMGAWLETHPGDYQGAYTAGQNAGGNVGMRLRNRELSRRQRQKLAQADNGQPATAAPADTTANPRR